MRREAEQTSSERWREEGRAGVFARLIERRLKRALTGDEAAALRGRLRERGPDEVEALVLDASREELAAWLARSPS